MAATSDIGLNDIDDKGEDDGAAVLASMRAAGVPIVAPAAPSARTRVYVPTDGVVVRPNPRYTERKVERGLEARPTWPIDLSLVPGAWHVRGGPPPPGHPRRCQAWNRMRMQCGRWAVRRSCYCMRHGHVKAKRTHRLKAMSRFYSRAAGVHLLKMLDEVAAHGDERSSLSEEVDLARVVAQRAVAIYEATVADENSAASPELKSLATAGLRAALDHVSEMVLRMEKASAISKATISVSDVSQVVAQVCRAIDDVLAVDHPELANKLIERVQAIKMPDKATVVVA